MNHLLEISQLSKTDIEALLQTAFSFKENQSYPQYTSVPLALLFYENSTRTRVSFELAAQRLGMPVIHFDVAHSSEKKGEELLDTFKTLHAMGVSYFVLRHNMNGLPQQLAEVLGKEIHIINAGDGTHAHPTQAMLDLMTIVSHKPDVSSLKIALVGNIKHSRVANSLQHLFQKVGVHELVMVAPKIWQPESLVFGTVTDSIIDGLSQADVVIGLRVQKERLQAEEHLDFAGYRKKFALTVDKMKHAKEDAIVMHPGPMNRGIEIDSEVADGPQSVILEQVNNGVFMRMAILEHMLH